jgi:hypothetical protein
MLVFCNGMPRSGSTWSYNVIIALLRHATPDQEVHGGYDEDVARFLATAGASSCSHVILKCHKLDSVGRTLARTGAARVIYTRRNLADAIVSLINMFGGDFDNAMAEMVSSLELYKLHRHGGNAVIIGYEEIMSSPLDAIGKIAGYLGLHVNDKAMKAVVEENSFGRAREKVEQINQIEGAAYDAGTLLHPHHIRDGSSGYGRKVLTEEQLCRVTLLLDEYGLKE